MLRNFTLFLCAVLCTLQSYSQDGSIDQSFGTGGYVRNPDGDDARLPRIVSLPDGSIVHFSGSDQPWSLRIVKYLSNGSIDPSFGIKQHNQLGGFPTNVWLLNDGKYLVSGTYSGQFGVARINANGTVDSSFSGDGIASTNIGGSSTGASDVVVQADGKIILVGYANVYDGSAFGAARFNADGTLDVTYDGDGLAYYDIGKGESPRTATLQPDGKLIIAGSIIETVSIGGPSTRTTPEVVAIRLNTSGTLDETFATNGVFKSLDPVYDDVVVDAQVRPTGQILLGVQRMRYSEYPSAGVIQLSSNGTLEGSGFRDVDGDYGSQLFDMAFQADGKILTAGFWRCTYCGPENDNNFYIVRFNSNLTIDGSFGNGGYVSLGRNPLMPNSAQNVYTSELGGSLASQGNKLLIGGYAYVDSASGMDRGKNVIYRLNNSSPLIQEYPNLNIGNPGSGSDGSYVMIPARIEAEDYTNMSGVQKENTQDAGGGQNVGYIDKGDWMEYRISVPSSGVYQLSLRVASPSSYNPQVTITNGNTTLGVVNIQNTGGYQNWTTQTISVTLPQGNHTIRLTSTGGGLWNINWLEFSQQGQPSGYITIPAKIEAENYAAQSGVQPEPTTDAGGGQNVGYIDNGDWMEYKIHVPTAGTYELSLRVASPSQYHPHVKITNGNVQLAVVNIQNTGGFQNWTTVKTMINLPQGNHTIRFTSAGFGLWNFNWMEFAYVPQPDFVAVPAKIEAEDYKAQSGVQTENTTDVGGGQNVGYIDLDDWMEYKISVSEPTNFNISFRLASPNSNGALEMRLNGAAVAAFMIDNTGGYQNWYTKTINMTLSQGNHVIRISSVGSASWNINWIDFARNTTATIARQDNELFSPAEGNAAGIYPNPVDNVLNLSLNNKERGKMQIAVINQQGMVVKNVQIVKDIDALRTQLSTQGLRPGQYLLRITINGKVETKRFVKM